MSNHKVQIINVQFKEGISQKTGRPYKIPLAQCIIDTEAGATVGVMQLSRELEATPPGVYVCEFTLGTDRENRVVPIVCKMTEVTATAARPAAPVAAAKAA